MRWCVRSALLFPEQQQAADIVDILVDDLFIGDTLPLVRALATFFADHEDRPWPIFEGPLSPRGQRLFLRLLRALEEEE